MGKIELKARRDFIEKVKKKIDSVKYNLSRLSNNALGVLKSGTDLFKTLKRIVVDAIPKVITEYHFIKKLLTIGVGALVLGAVALVVIAIVLIFVYLSQ